MFFYDFTNCAYKGLPFASIKPLTAAGDMMACGTSAAQFWYKVDGADYAFYSAFPDSITVYNSPNGTQVGMSNNDNSRSVYFSFTANQAGTYPVTRFSIVGNGINGYVGIPTFKPGPE